MIRCTFYYADLESTQRLFAGHSAKDSAATGKFSKIRLHIDRNRKRVNIGRRGRATRRGVLLHNTNNPELDKSIYFSAKVSWAIPCRARTTFLTWMGTFNTESLVPCRATYHNRHLHVAEYLHVANHLHVGTVAVNQFID